METIVILSILVVVMYLLYISGLMTIKTMWRCIYAGSVRIWNQHGSARFSSCDGTMKNILRFRAARPYRFTFAPTLTQGKLRAEVLDAKKQLLLALDDRHPTGVVDAQRHARYYLVLHFENASGQYTLDWQ